MVMLGQPQRKKLSSQNLKRYRNKNLCFGCGQKGHQKTNCPQKGDQKKKKVTAVVQEVQEDPKKLLGKDSDLEE